MKKKVTMPTLAIMFGISLALTSCGKETSAVQKEETTDSQTENVSEQVNSTDKKLPDIKKGRLYQSEDSYFEFDGFTTAEEFQAGCGKGGINVYTLDTDESLLMSEEELLKKIVVPPYCEFNTNDEKSAFYNPTDKPIYAKDCVLRFRSDPGAYYFDEIVSNPDYAWIQEEYSAGNYDSVPPIDLGNNLFFIPDSLITEYKSSVSINDKNEEDTYPVTEYSSYDGAPADWDLSNVIFQMGGSEYSIDLSDATDWSIEFCHDTKYALSIKAYFGQDYGFVLEPLFNYSKDYYRLMYPEKDSKTIDLSNGHIYSYYEFSYMTYDDNLGLVIGADYNAKEFLNNKNAATMEKIESLINSHVTKLNDLEIE